MNLDASQVIISNLEFARYIKNEINEITGITPQREGMVSNRETLGGINKSLQQSSFITEPYFYVHDNTKLRLLELNLETAKFCYRDQSFSINIMDDGLIGRVLNIDGPILSETSYGLYLSDGKDDAELFQFIRQYSHAALQNDTAKFKDLFEIMKSKSIAAVGKRMEEAEAERLAEKEYEQERQYQSQQSVAEMNIKWEMMKFTQSTEIEMRKLENDILLKEMDLEGLRYKVDAGDNQKRADIEKELQISKDKLKTQLEQMKKKNEEFNQKLAQERELFSRQLASKNKEKVKADV
jgi:hypothetical protein